MIITDIKRRKNLYDIFLDGEFSFTITDETQYKLNFRVDSNFVPDEYIINLLMEDEVIRCKNKAFYFLSFGNKTVYSLKCKLKEHNFSDESISKTLVYLIDNDYLDDYMFAQNLANREISLGKSMNQIKQKLYQKKIDKKIIDRIISEIDFNEQENAYKIAVKKYNSLDKTNIYNVVQKIRNVLIYKGFSYDIINTVINEIKNLYKEEMYNNE